MVRTQRKNNYLHVGIDYSYIVPNLHTKSLYQFMLIFYGRRFYMRLYDTILGKAYLDPLAQGALLSVGRR